MARTPVTVQSLPGAFTTTLTRITFAASDNVNGNNFVATGREVVLFNNTTGGPITATVRSTTNGDPLGRTADINAVSIPAGQIWASQMFTLTGWEEPDATIWIDTSAAMQMAVIRVPNAVAV